MALTNEMLLVWYVSADIKDGDVKRVPMYKWNRDDVFYEDDTHQEAIIATMNKHQIMGQHI